ncbi:hypothetical protein HanXRQr2_Chr11g0508591 [Helianthus annuus]|uniref:Uncharacterized protein n=1 Tax=Helianthus annuus TaxID=4232 RepID=A0A251US24_HELAN|nr:hypothetical protein HanXRQr2_Chr11g0508591 [Helianthus annuus]KAJ0511008.1 hypothetical protein HanIR_Chr11g0547131 [Helianthus annuus]KAJ0549859.1 hypothetical protein HanHA300_Chr07g0238801 [Helianthus annuus]KAJ0562817.1 hypothetical protein HanHA89_Chr07g0256011 [Helianthus annuus]KAJ0639629.1 hypothetical protein HanLR1_Chr16g0605921 [Helianthus annuus]
MEEMNSVLSFVEHSYWQSWTVVYTSFFPQPHILDQNTTWFTEFSPPPSAFHLPPDQQVFLFVMKTLWLDPAATQHEQTRSTKP